MPSSFLEKILFGNPSYDNQKLKDLIKGKTVIITGASYGIGEQLALELAQYNVRLVLIARTKEKLIEIQHKVKDMGSDATIYTSDFKQEDQVDVLLTELQKEERIDFFISNAGKSIRRPFEESLNRLHDFERTMSINYHTPVKLLLGLYPTIKKTKGHILNVSAVNVLLPAAPKWAAYQASKTAFDQWFTSCSYEMNLQDVHTTSIYLPLVKTRMIEPTEAYKNVPAMSAIQVSKLICKCLLTKQKTHKPWWLFAAQLGSLLFNGITRKVLLRSLKS